MLVNLVADAVTKWLSAWGAAGVFFLMAVESACIPVPSEVVLPFAGILVREGTMSFQVAFLAGVTGQLAGSALTYVIGRMGGRPLVMKYGKYFLIRTHEVEKAEEWFARYGEATSFLARLVPGVRTFISLPAGIARMPFWRFLAYSLLGVAPWTALLVWLGEQVGPVWRDPAWAPIFHWAEIIVIAGLLALIGRFIIVRLRESNQ